MPGRFFQIVNFKRFQHYKDRNPPWIKLYNSLLDDYEFSCLQDASKSHLILLWLLASRFGNRIPWDEKWIQRRIVASQPIRLKPLQDAGFIEEIEVLADCKQSACPETETETMRPP